jgi:hypothetical protein
MSRSCRRLNQEPIQSRPISSSLLPSRGDRRVRLAIRVVAGTLPAERLLGRIMTYRDRSWRLLQNCGLGVQRRCRADGYG